MEIFKLFGSIMVDSSEAEKSISKTGSEAEGLATKLGKGITTAAKWGAAIAAGASAAGAALLGVANKSAEAADEVDKMSQKIGLSKEAYQEWRYAMGQSGVDISVMQTGVKTLTNLMDSAKNGTASATETFEQLGVSIYDANGALKDQETMMSEAIMALANMEDSTERAKLATELFGKAGTELEPLLNSGADGIQELMDRAHELGLVMSDEAVDAGVVFGDTLADVKDSLSMVVTNIGIQVMPMIQTLLDWVLEHMPEILETVSGVMEGIQNGIAVMQAFWEEHGDAISAKVEMVMDVIKEVVRIAMDVLQELIVVAMAVLSGDWEAAWDGIVDVVTNIGSALYEAGKAVFSRLWDGIKSVWSNISNWVSEKVNWLADKITFWNNGTEQVSSGTGRFSHASGLSYVPYDNYPANLHRGEVVLNASQGSELLGGFQNALAAAVNGLATLQGGAGLPEEVTLTLKSDDGQTMGRWLMPFVRSENKSNPEVVSDAL